MAQYIPQWNIKWDVSDTQQSYEILFHVQNVRMEYVTDRMLLSSVN